jgi:PAS domain S-box-containing protein
MVDNETAGKSTRHTGRNKPHTENRGNNAESRYQEYVDQLPDVVFSLDPAGRFILVSSQAEAFFGCPARAFLGRPIWSYAHAEDRDVVRSLLDMPRESVWDEEATFVDVEGQKKFVRIRCKPLLDHQGTLLGFRGILRDRTAKHELEEKIATYHDSLRESEQRYRRLVEEVPDVIFSLDREGRFAFVNAPVEPYLGYAVPQMLGKPLSDYVASEHKDLARSLLEMSPDSIWDEEMTVLDSRRRRKWVRIRCKLLIDANGNVTGFEGVMRDRTARKKLEEELRASKEELLAKMKIIDDLYGHIVQSERSRVIAQHTAEVAHELRQPLTIIGGFARRMGRQLETCQKLDPEYQRECIQLMIREVQ